MYTPTSRTSPGKIVTLKLNSKPSTDGAWEITVKPTGDESGVRYLDWINNNRKRVEEATGGRIGYMHVPDTAIEGVIQFDKAFNAQLDKDGIIVDERDNSGGQIPDFYTEKLKRQLLAVVAARDTKDVPWPPVAIYGPKIMIVNELAGSGGDAFPWFFRREKDWAHRRRAHLGRTRGNRQRPAVCATAALSPLRASVSGAPTMAANGSWRITASIPTTSFRSVPIWSSAGTIRNLKKPSNWPTKP